MDELPPWLIPMGEHPELRDALVQLFANEEFAARMGRAVAGNDTLPPFPVQVGGRDMLDRFNARRREQDRVKFGGPNVGGVAMYSVEPDRRVHSGAIVVDFDRILNAVAGDSARARGLVRDALVHEFGHILPVAEARSIDAATGDPRPGARNAANHPVMKNENMLRGLLNLPPRAQYGLLGAR